MGLWILFVAMVSVALAIDLGLKSHRHRSQAISMGEAARWTVLWVALTLIFAGAVYAVKGHQRALEFLTAYLIEESLSVDNMFVFALIFQFFRISAAHQPRVLKWGILGAVVMRLVLIFTGVSLLAHSHWVMYLFGGLLIITAVKMVTDDEKSIQPNENALLKIFQRFIPITTEQQGENFLTDKRGRYVGTPLLAALLVVEASDLVFALDSIPAVLAVSSDPFIVFTSNIFAILGLRALYFLISGFLGLFRYLKYGLGVVLAFIGMKMLLIDVVPIKTGVSLLVVLACLGVSIVCSLTMGPRHE